MLDLSQPIWRVDVAGSTRPAQIYLAPTLDGLLAPYALRTPSDEGVFPFVFLAYGNGGYGVEWLESRLATHGYIMERLLAAGYACAWGCYRTEVELGFHRGGPLVTDQRSGMGLMNRAPLEYEDELAILRHVGSLDGIDADRLGHLGVSHAGEMLFKLASHYPGVLRAGIAVEPANHEFLDLSPDQAPAEERAFRNVEEMQMHDTSRVRARSNVPLALERLSPLDLPILVVGRDDDHLQGIFRLSYELLVEGGHDATWVSWPHPDHGFVFPERRPDSEPACDDIQDRAISHMIAFFDQHLRSS